jgi:hypothetical protein
MEASLTWRRAQMTKLCLLGRSDRQVAGFHLARIKPRHHDFQRRWRGKWRHATIRAYLNITAELVASSSQGLWREPMRLDGRRDHAELWRT